MGALKKKLIGGCTTTLLTTPRHTTLLRIEWPLCTKNHTLATPYHATLPWYTSGVKFTDNHSRQTTNHYTAPLSVNQSDPFGSFQSPQASSAPAQPARNANADIMALFNSPQPSPGMGMGMGMGQ